MEGIEVKAISGREVELWIDSEGDLAIYLNLMGREEQSLGAWFGKEEATKIRDFINKYLEQATR
jgi:hypothetical protein